MPGSDPRMQSAPASALVAWAPLAAVLACAAFVFAGSLGYFFSQDDFALLARARGLEPPSPGLWRWLSGTAYFQLMRPFGLDALPYHAVSLAAHAACAGVLYALLRRRFSTPAALLGALVFVTHPALYTAVYWISAGNEIFALLLALAAIGFAARPGREAWASLPLFALSLLSKETTLLLPVALWISPGWLDRPGQTAAAGEARRRLGVRVALSAIALLYLAVWLWSDAFGTRSRLDVAAPYAVGVGGHLLANAVTYLGWTAGTWLPIARSFDDVADLRLWPWAAALVVAWLAGFFSRGLRASGWLAGGVTFAVLIAPVLGLRNHTYHYYLYAPLIGASWCAAALLDTLSAARAPAPARASAESPRAPRARSEERGRGPRPAPRPVRGRGFRGMAPALAWPVAIGGGALLLLNGALFVRKIERMPFVDEKLRADPTVDRARIARRVYDGLGAAALPDRARLLFWSPASHRFELRIRPGADVVNRETYWERNVRAALQDGRAVRVMFPQVDSVEFIRGHRPAADPSRFVLYEPDGSLSVETPARLDSMLRTAAGR